MNLIVQVDAAGWIPIEPQQSPPVWQSVTSDEMNLTATPLTHEFPQSGELTAVRRYFQQLIRTRGGALISCDVLTNGGTAMVRTVAKYHKGRGHAMAYSASLTASRANAIVELAVRGSEDDLTGVREALITSELLQKAGPSEKQQLAEKIFPIEWKFERYAPGTRGDLAYLLSDDESYDARFPDHPLSRVRRWLRRQERAFQLISPDPSSGESPDKLARTGGVLRSLRKMLTQPRPGLNELPAPESLRIEIRYAETKSMSFDEMVRELGSQVAGDAILLEGLKRVNPPPPPPLLGERQKICRDQRNGALKKMFEKEQERAAQGKQVRDDTENLLKELTVEKALVSLARERGTGRWHTIRESAGPVLAVFTSAAFVNDFIACKALECEPVEMNLKELFASFSELQRGQISALEFDRCPRCAAARPTLQFSAVTGEGELLRWYAASIASRRILTAKNIRVALQEPDPTKRLAILRYTLEHIDPGSVDVHGEIAKLRPVSET